ncbi:MAG: flavin reductase family protein [Bacteroidetes bacterium]|nr:flavin reductase family protein [Bacteroidota bacterium]
MKKAFDIKNIPGKDLYGLLTSAVIPRPIAFASTVDSNGNVNLSPFSYFNVFSSNPPILVFSPVRRSADGSTKDTWQNLLEVKEVVINLVNYRIVREMSLASAGYDKGVNEFEKSGLTEEPSVKIRPPRVKEAPIAFECKVNQIIELGDQGGAGTLMICEVVYAHIEEYLIDKDGKIDPFKLDAVARLGNSWYSRVDRNSIFEIPKPLGGAGIGVDELPGILKPHFTSGELAMLAGVDKLPEYNSEAGMNQDKVNMVKAYLKEGDVKAAWNHLKD